MAVRTAAAFRVTAKILLIGYLVLFTWAGIAPYDRATWWEDCGDRVGLGLAVLAGLRVLADGVWLDGGVAVPAHDRRALHV